MAEMDLLKPMREKHNHGFSFYTNVGFFESKMARDPKFAEKIQAPARRHQKQMRIAKLIPTGATHSPTYINDTLI